MFDGPGSSIDWPHNSLWGRWRCNGIPSQFPVDHSTGSAPPERRTANLAGALTPRRLSVATPEFRSRPQSFQIITLAVDNRHSCHPFDWPKSGPFFLAELHCTSFIVYLSFSLDILNHFRWLIIVFHLSNALSSFRFWIYFLSSSWTWLVRNEQKQRIGSLCMKLWEKSFSATTPEFSNFAHTVELSRRKSVSSSSSHLIRPSLFSIAFHRTRNEIDKVKWMLEMLSFERTHSNVYGCLMEILPGRKRTEGGIPFRGVIFRKGWNRPNVTLIWCKVIHENVFVEFY